MSVPLQRHSRIERMTHPVSSSPSDEPGNEPQVDSSPAPGQEAAVPAAPADTAPTAPPRAEADPLRRSRASNFWVAIVGFGVLLVLLVIFILQNRQSVEVSYLGLNGHMPLAAAMLISVAAGLLLAAIAGSVRILQLRRRVRRGVR
jgi:putative membrane protein